MESNGEETILEVQNLKTYYSTLRGKLKAVDGFDQAVKKGDTIGLTGESGCGKTTVALSIMRLLPANAEIIQGKILFHGDDLARKSRKDTKKIRGKRISMIPQGSMNALNPVMRVGEQVSEVILEHENVKKKEVKRRVEELFDLTGLDKMRTKDYPHELSGGMKQRVLIAMALACNPELVIADEPTTALDVVIQGQIIHLMKILERKFNLSVILITHDLSIVNELCNKVTIMYAGKPVEFGDTHSFFDKPLHPYSQGLLESFLPITGTKKRREGIPGEPPRLINPPTGCRFHPRCPRAFSRCREEEPKLINRGKGRYTACHLYN